MKLISPKVGQDFVWLAEYVDGSHLTEFDLDNCRENSFYSIEREKLIRFGLLGHNLKLVYEIFGGYFNLAGNFIEIVLIDNDKKEYGITGKQEPYLDIITFKDAEASFNIMGGGHVESKINKYNFGFKKTLNYDDMQINARIIATIPYRQPSYFNFRLVCNRDFNGELVIRYSGKVMDTLSCQFDKDKGYELNWVIK